MSEERWKMGRKEKGDGKMEEEDGKRKKRKKRKNGVKKSSELAREHHAILKEEFLVPGLGLEVGGFPGFAEGFDDVS